MKTRTKVGFIAFVACIALMCSFAVRADTYVQPLQCLATSIALNVPSTSATVQCTAVTPPPITGACAQGSTGDVPGYTAKCSGYFTLHSGTNTMKGPSSYTFSFLFGDSWPGDRSGTADIFTVGLKQFISVPFKPTPGHSIGLSENDTYTQHPITFSISTSPGMFNNGKPGNGVICVRTNNPSIAVSSNGLQGSQCPVRQDTTYWFNVIAAFYNTNTGQWETRFTGANAQFAVNFSGFN